jgi:hypothetical protein
MSAGNLSTNNFAFVSITEHEQSLVEHDAHTFGAESSTPCSSDAMVSFSYQFSTKNSIVDFCRRLKVHISYFT